MLGSSDGSSRKKIIVRIVITYLVVFMATLGFTGIINYGKAIGPVVKYAGKVLERKKTPAKKSKPVETQQNYPVSTAPITLPGPIAAAPTVPATAGVNAQIQVTEENVRELAKIYSSMDSEQAAKIFDNLTDKEIIMLLKEMRGTAAGDILAGIDSARAAIITSKMMSTTTVGASKKAGE